jgi:hypothetical protein
MDVSLVRVGLTVNPPPCAAQQRAENCSGMPGSASPLAYLACPPNAAAQARQTAGARHERTLFAVACSRLLGSGVHAFLRTLCCDVHSCIIALGLLAFFKGYQVAIH